MGWASGSSLFGRVIEILQLRVEFNKRCELYRELIDAFEDSDCDTLYECVGHDEAFDKVWRELYPEE